MVCKMETNFGGEGERVLTALPVIVCVFKKKFFHFNLLIAHAGRKHILNSPWVIVSPNCSTVPSLWISPNDWFLGLCPSETPTIRMSIRNEQGVLDL